jgi:hypothetical protein
MRKAGKISEQRTGSREQKRQYEEAKCGLFSILGVPFAIGSLRYAIF